MDSPLSKKSWKAQLQQVLQNQTKPTDLPPKKLWKKCDLGLKPPKHIEYVFQWPPKQYAGIQGFWFEDIFLTDQFKASNFDK